MWLQIISMLKLLDMTASISAGKVANITKYNFIVSAQNSTGYHSFAGIIISIYHVLTSCSALANVTERRAEPLENLGGVRLVAGLVATPLQIRYPERSYIHPLCKLGQEIILYDLAMYKVFKPWDFEGGVNVAWLPVGNSVELNRISQEMSDKSEKCTVIGRGRAKSYFNRLLQDDFVLSSSTECKLNLCKRCETEEIGLCTKPSRKICHGDQGGPIICRQAVWGIISSPIFVCGKLRYHNYARVDTKITKLWITNISGAMSFATPLLGNFVFIILCILIQLHFH